MAQHHSPCLVDVLAFVAQKPTPQSVRMDLDDVFGNLLFSCKTQITVSANMVVVQFTMQIKCVLTAELRGAAFAKVGLTARTRMDVDALSMDSQFVFCGEFRST